MDALDESMDKFDELGKLKVKSMQRPGTETIRAEIRPSQPKRKITNITNS